jgi:hypothetical protein
MLFNHDQNTGRREHGVGKLKAIFWTLVLIAIVFVAVKLVPPYMSEYQLQDKMITEARFGSVNHRTDDQLRDSIYRTIQDLDIPASREDIKIENNSQLVKISVEYTVTLDFLAFQTQLRFNPVAENHSL